MRLINDFRPYIPDTWADWPEEIRFRDVLSSQGEAMQRHRKAGRRYWRHYRSGLTPLPIRVRYHNGSFKIVDGDSRCLGWMMLSEAEQESIVIRAWVVDNVIPAKEPFDLYSEAKQSGFWFSDGSYVFVEGALKHHQLFRKLQRKGVINADSLEDLWGMGVVRVHLGTSFQPAAEGQRYVLSIQGAQDAVLARMRECAGWVGPDGARLFKTRMDIIPPKATTDEGFLSFVGTLRTALAWLLLGCPVEAMLGRHQAYEAVPLTEYEIVAALKKGGIGEWV